MTNTTLLPEAVTIITNTANDACKKRFNSHYRQHGTADWENTNPHNFVARSCGELRGEKHALDIIAHFVSVHP